MGRLGSWNVHGIADKGELLFREIGKFDMEIVVLIETKNKKKGTEEQGGSVRIYSAVPKEERARGVFLTIRKTYKKCIKSLDQIQINHKLLLLTNR